VKSAFHVGIDDRFSALGLTSALCERLSFGTSGAAETIAVKNLSASQGEELTAEAIESFDALVLLDTRVGTRALAGNQRLQVISRFGVGYEGIDIDACTAAGVVVSITPDGIRRPVATAALSFILALAHRLFEKDRLSRSGSRVVQNECLGVGLRGTIVGTVGFGSTAQELHRLLAPLETKRLAYDPYVDPEVSAAQGVQLVELEQLLSDSDFVCVMCPLTPETTHLFNEARLHSMKPAACLINVSRGLVVDTEALTDALVEGRLRGAALDVTDPEPLSIEHPLFRFRNVIITPHTACWTNELIEGNLVSIASSLHSVMRGQRPRFLVNGDAWESSRAAGGR